MNTNKKIAFSIFVILAISLAAFMPQAKAYQNSDYNFSITPPGGWTTTGWTEASSSGAANIVFDDPDVDGAFMTVIVAPVSSGETLTTFASAFKSTWSTYPDYMLISEQTAYIGQTVSDQLVISYSKTLNGQTYVLKEKYVLILDNQYAYCIAFIAMSPSDYSQEISTVNQSFETFQLLSSTPTDNPSQPPRTIPTQLPFILPTASSQPPILASPTLLIGVSVVIVVVVVVVVLLMVLKHKKRKQQSSTQPSYSMPPPPPPV